MAEHNFGIQSNSKIEQQLYDILCANKGLLIFTCLTAGVTEELLFRGYLLPRIKALTNSNVSAVLISAFLFGIAHYGYGDINRVLFPFIIGIIFGSFYLKYRNISILIICHFAMDLYSMYSQCK